MKPEREQGKQVLTSDDIHYLPATGADPFGQVFLFENNIYRRITPGLENLAMEIVNLSSRWNENGLIETSESTYRLADAPLVLSHRTIEFVSYCQEWLPEMFRDAAIAYLVLQKQLIDDGFVLKDGHPWNILFDKGNPVYIDVGSIIPFDEVTLERALEEFRIYFLLPIKLFSIWGNQRTYEFLSLSIPNKTKRKKVARRVWLLPFWLQPWLKSINGLDRMIKKVREISFLTKEKTKWSCYQQRDADIRCPHHFNDKERAVYEALQSVEGVARTVLEIGCNKGWYSLLAENMGYRVVATDIDVISLSRLYGEVKEQRLDILPLYMDICNPTRAHGLDDSYPGFLNRMKFDIVLAMAVVHHLAYKSKFSFEVFAERMAILASRIAIIEFIPSEDIHVNNWDQEGMEWYTRSHFIECFMNYFDTYKVYYSTPRPREVFVFEKLTH